MRMKKSDMPKIGSRPFSGESAAPEVAGVVSKRAAVGQNAVSLAADLMRRMHDGPLSAPFLRTNRIGRRHRNFVDRLSLWQVIHRRWSRDDNAGIGSRWPALIFTRPIDRTPLFDPAVGPFEGPRHSGAVFNAANSWTGRLPSIAEARPLGGSTDPSSPPRYRGAGLSEFSSGSISRKAASAAIAIGRTQENPGVHAVLPPAEQSIVSRRLLRASPHTTARVGASESKSASRHTPVSVARDRSDPSPQPPSMSSGRYSAVEEPPRSEAVRTQGGKEFFAPNSGTSLPSMTTASVGTLRFRRMMSLTTMGRRLPFIRRQSMGVSGTLGRQEAAGNFVSVSRKSSGLTAASSIGPARVRPPILQTQPWRSVFRSSGKGNDLSIHDLGFNKPVLGGHGFQKPGGQAMAKKAAAISKTIGLSSSRTNGFTAGGPVADPGEGHLTLRAVRESSSPGESVAEKSAKVLRSVRQTPVLLLSRGSENWQASAPILNLRHPTIGDSSSAMVSYSGQRPGSESTHPTVPIINTVGPAVSKSPVRNLFVQAASIAIGARPIATLHQPAQARAAGEVVRPDGLPAQPTPGLTLARHRPTLPDAESAAHGMVVQKQGLPCVFRSSDVALSPSASGVLGNRAARSGEAAASKIDAGSGKASAPPSADIAGRMAAARLNNDPAARESQVVLRKTATTIPKNSLPVFFGASVPRKGDDAGRVPHPFYNRSLGLGIIRRLVEAASSDNTGRMASATRHDNPASQEPGTVLRKTVSTSGADDSRWMFRAFIPRIGDSGRPLQTFHSRPLGLGLVHRLAESTLSDNTGRMNSATGHDNPVSLDSDIALQKTAVTIRTAPWPDLFRAPIHRKENAESGRSRHPFPGVPLSLESVRKVADPVAVMRNLFRETNFGKPSPNRLPVVAADITSESPAQEAYSTSARSRTDAPAGVLHRHRPGIGLPVFQPAVTLMERTISRSSTGQPVEAVSARHRRPTANLPATGLPWISPVFFGAGADQFSNRDSMNNAANRLPFHRPPLQRTVSPVPATAAPGGSAAEASPPETEPETAPSRIDIDAVVEKTWEKIMRKLEIEQERRGQTSWRFRS